jgi:hypothetical protein
VALSFERVRGESEGESKFHSGSGKVSSPHACRAYSEPRVEICWEIGLLEQLVFSFLLLLLEQVLCLLRVFLWSSPTILVTFPTQPGLAIHSVRANVSMAICCSDVLLLNWLAWTSSWFADAVSCFQVNLHVLAVATSCLHSTPHASQGQKVLFMVIALFPYSRQRGRLMTANTVMVSVTHLKNMGMCHTRGLIPWRTDWPTDRLTDRLTVSLTDWLTDRPTVSLTWDRFHDRLTHWVTYSWL